MTGAGSSSAPATTHFFDDHRPRCHLAPPAGWMNDPNGPVFYKGRYHMFYQHLPDACEWDFGIVWGHAVSPDLVHWEHLPAALVPTPGWVDADGCFSGCCIIDPCTGRPVILYTGVRLRSNTSAGPLPPPEHDLGMVWIESQCAAVPADPNDDLLIEWKKVQTPFLPLPPSEMELTGWRDPFAFSVTSLVNSNPSGTGAATSTFENGKAIGEPDGARIENDNNTSSTSILSPSSSTSQPSSQEQQHTCFRILMGSGIKGKGGTALIYRSTDLMQGWELEGTLCEGTSEDSGVVWECPLLVPLEPVPHHQRSGHPHVPPPWLHQPSTQKNISNTLALREALASPGAVTNQLQQHQKEVEEKEKPHAAAGAAAGGVGTTSSLGGRFARRAAGILSPARSPSPSSPLSRLSTQTTGILPFHHTTTTISASKDGSPAVPAAAAAAAAPAAKKPHSLSPKTISTAVKDLFHHVSAKKETSSSRELEKRTKGQSKGATAAMAEELDEFEFASSGAASPGETAPAGLGTLDRQYSIEMWPSSAEATSPAQEELLTAESYQSISANAGPATDFPAHELAAKLERAATLEHWNTQSLGPGGNGGGGNGTVALNATAAIGGSAGDGRHSIRPSSRHSTATLPGVPERRADSVAATIGSRLDIEEEEEEEEEEENVVGDDVGDHQATAGAALPAPAATNTDDGNEDRFAMAFSRVPALQVKKKSAASLGLLEETTTAAAPTAADYGGVAPAADVVEKQTGHLPKLSVNTSTTIDLKKNDLLSMYSTDMTPMHQQSHILSSSQQNNGASATTPQQRQWHFFTISPDAPTNPVLYWTGFVSHDTTDNGGGYNTASEKETEEDAGFAIGEINNKNFASSQNSLPPPPQFEIDSAKGPFRLDLGDILYAPNVCQDDQGRWILWGWLQERRKMGTYSYAGCLTLPRVLHATDEGRLVQAPAPEVASLRQGREFHAHHVTLYPESMLPIQRVSGDRLDIECTIERGSALAAGLLFRSHEAEAEGSTAIVYDWDRNHLEAIFNVPPNWQPCVLPPVPPHPSSYPSSATAAGGDRDGFSFTEEDLIGLDDAIHFDPAAYLCTPRYSSISRTPSVTVFSPDVASSPRAAPLARGGGSSSALGGGGGGGGGGGISFGGDVSPPSSPADDSSAAGSLISGGVISEIASGLGGLAINAVQRQGSSLQQCLQRSGSYASLAGGPGIAGAVASAAGNALERAAGGALGRTSSLLGSSVPRVGSFIQRQSSFLAAGSPRSQAIIDAAEAAEMDAELSTLLEDLAAPMRGAGEEGAAPPQAPEPRRVGGPLLMRPSDKLHLRIFVDHSCVEVFTGTGEVLSTRIYRGQQPQSSSFFDGTGQVDAGIEFVAFGGAAVLEKVSAYEVGSAWKEAETTPSSRWGTPTAAAVAAAAGSEHAAPFGGSSSYAPSPMAGIGGGKSAAERADELFDELLMGF